MERALAAREELADDLDPLVDAIPITIVLELIGAALDPGAGRYVAAYMDRLTKAFRHALNNGQQSGKLDWNADLDELAAFFTMALIGVVACIRAEAPPEQVRAACRVATSILDTRH